MISISKKTFGAKAQQSRFYVNQHQKIIPQRNDVWSVDAVE